MTRATDVLADRRQHPQRHAGLFAEARDIADQVARGARDRQQQLIGAELPRRAPGSRPAPRAPSRRGARARGSVDRRRSSPTTRRPSSGWRWMSLSTWAPASPAPISRTRVPAVCSTERRRNREQTALEPDRAEDHHRRRAPEHDDGEREWVLTTATDEQVEPEHQHETRDPRQDHTPRLLHARVSPHLPVETEQVVAEQVDQHDRRQEDPEIPPAVGRHTTVESKDERHQVRRARRPPRRGAPGERRAGHGRRCGWAGRAGPGTRGSRSSRSRPPHRRRQQTVGKEAADFTVPQA